MVTVIRIDGSSVQLPITPEDNNKKVWDFLKEKLPLEGDRSQVSIRPDVLSQEDVSDRLITEFDGKKLIVSPKAGK